MSNHGGVSGGLRKLNENKPGEPPFQMKVEPNSVLRFKCQPNVNIVNSGPINVDLKITNTTTFRQTFKVKCTNNEFFRVRPPIGFVKPDEAINLKVTFHSLTKFPDNNKHFFAIYHFRTDDFVIPARQLWTGPVKPEGVKRILASFETSEGQPISVPTTVEVKTPHAAASVTAIPANNKDGPPASSPVPTASGTTRNLRTAIHHRKNPYVHTTQFATIPNMEGDTSFSESTTTSHFEFKRTVTVNPLMTENAKSLRRRIRDLKIELLEIKTDTQADEHATDEISTLISEVTILVETDRIALIDAQKWPNALLQTSEKWIAIWKSDIGKKMLNSRSAKTSESAILVAAITKQVEYIREWVAIFRERKRAQETKGVDTCKQLKTEIAELNFEIHALRRECLDWEKRAAFNRARTMEMIEQHHSLQRSVDEKEMQVAEIKNDIHEFERELLALSYTLDQLSFH